MINNTSSLKADQMMISTKEVFDRMKRYRRERNQLRQEMEQLKALPQQILALKTQVAELEKQIQDSSTTINREELKQEILIELNNKIENILISKSSEDVSSDDWTDIDDSEISASKEEDIEHVSSKETFFFLESEDENQQINNISSIETENIETVENV